MANETDSVFAAEQQNGKGELYRLMMSILKEGETDKQETDQQRQTPEVEKAKDEPAAQQTAVAHTVDEPQSVQQQTVQPQEQPEQQAEQTNGDVEQPAQTYQPVQDVQADELDDDTKDLLAVKNHNIDDARKYVEQLGNKAQTIMASGMSEGAKRDAQERYERAAKALNERIEAHNAEQKAENDRLRAEAERKQAQAKKEHDEKYADINYVSDWMDGHKVNEANNTMLASEGFKEGAAAASGKDIFGIAKAAKDYISENTGKLSTAAINDYVNGMLAANRLKEKYGEKISYNIEPIDSVVLENKDIPDSVKKEFVKVRTPKEFGDNNYQSILGNAVDDFVRLFEKEYRREQGKVEKKAMGDYENIAKNPFADADDKDAARMVYASKVLTGVDLKPMIDRAFNSIPKDRMAALTLALSKDFGYDENKAAEYIANEFQRVCLARTGAKVNSDTEAVIIGGLMNTLVGSLAQASMRSTGGGNKLTLLDTYSESIDERAKEWAKQGMAGYGKIALRSATTMAGDSPAFGGIGKLVGGGTKWSLVRLLPRLSKGVTPKAGDAAFKMLSMTNSGRVVIGVANGAGLGAVYSPLAYSLGSLARGVAPELGEALKSSASGAVDFSMMGYTPSIMNYGADKELKLFNGTGKAATAIRVATNIAFKDIFGPGSNAALVTAKDVLLSSEKISEDLKSYYFEKFGEFLGMHVPGKLSNIRHIADEYKVRTQLNESVFTKEELRSLGYKSVKQMFDDIYAPNGKNSPGYFMKDGKAIASKLYGITVNPNVLESAKMKLLTAIGGGAIATPTITRSEIVSEYGEKGKEVYTVRTYTSDGKAFSERDFGSLKDAKLEETRLGTVIKRNNVAIAEGARDAQWMDTCSERATRTVLSELNGTATEKELTDMLKTAFEKDRNGEQLTDGEKRMLKRFDEVYLQNLRSENADNSSSVRRDFNNSMGVDIDKILAKDYYKWSESEREAVDDYIKSLNGENTAKDMPSGQTEPTVQREPPAEPTGEPPVVEAEKVAQQEVAAHEKETWKPGEETTGKGDIGIEDYIKINKADEETANDIREDAENYTDEVDALRSESEQALRYSNGESSEKPEHWDYWKEKFGLEEPKAKTDEEVKPVEEPKSDTEPIEPKDEKPTEQPKEQKAEEKPVEVETPKEEAKADTKDEVEQAAETEPVEEAEQEQPTVDQLNQYFSHVHLGHELTEKDFGDKARMEMLTKQFLSDKEQAIKYSNGELSEKPEGYAYMKQMFGLKDPFKQPKGEETAYKKGEELVVEHDGKPVTIVVDAVGKGGNVTKSHVKSSGEPYHSKGKVVFTKKEKPQEQAVKDWVDDTASEARKRGYRIVNGQRVERQGALSEGTDIVYGDEHTTKFSQNDKPTTRFAVVSASKVQPSHIRGQRNPAFFNDEGQPKNRTDQVSVAREEEIAKNIDPEEITVGVTAYQGAPTINSRGEVIQGNNRAAALREMYSGGYGMSAKKYRQFLKDNAKMFGLTPEDIDRIEDPVLVNVADVSDAEAIRLGQLKATDNESGGVQFIEPKPTVQKLVGANKLTRFMDTLLDSENPMDSIKDLIRKNGVNALKFMRDMGIINETQYNSAFNAKDTLSSQARSDLEGVIRHAMFDGGPTGIEEMFDLMPDAAQKGILETIARDFNGDEQSRIKPVIQESILAYHNAVSTSKEFANAKTAEQAARAMRNYARQVQLIGEEQVLPEKYFSKFALLLAERYRSYSKLSIKAMFNELYDKLQGVSESSGDLFSGEVAAEKLNINEAFKKVFNYGDTELPRGDVLGDTARTGEKGEPGSEGGTGGRGQDKAGERGTDRQGGTGGTSEEGSNSLIGSASKVADRVRINSRLKDLSERAKTAKTDEERAQVASERAEVVSEYVKGEKGRSVSVVPTQDALADAVESRDLKNEVRQHTESGDLLNGVYDKRTGKIHIVAENVETADDIDAVYIHESSHRYSREVDNNRAAGELVDNHTTEELEQALREVAGDDVADVYMACKPGKGDFAYRRMLADEILAYSCVKRNAGEKTGITNEKINNQTKQHYEKVSDYFGGRKRDGGKSDRGETETGEGLSTEPSAGEHRRGGANDREEEVIDSEGLFSVAGRNANGGNSSYDSKHSEIEQAVNRELEKNSTSDDIKAEIDRVKKLRAEATKEYLSGKPHSDVAKGDAAALRERLNELNAKKTVAVENERSAKLTEKLAELNSKLIEATESGDKEKAKSITTEIKRLKTDISNTGIRARYKAKISEIKSKSENVSDLAKSLVKYISGELSPILAKEMGKAEFNALVGSVRDIAKQWNAKDGTEQDRNNLATKLDDTVRKVDDVIVGIETRKLINDLAEMLSVKTTKKDSGGKKVGVKVSNTVRIAIETLKGMFRGFEGEFGNGLKSLVKSLEGMLSKKKSLQGRLKELELSEASADERLNSGAITKDEYDAEIEAINRERDDVKSEMANFDTVFSDALSETNDAIDAAVPRSTEEYNKLWNDLMAKQQDEQDGVAQMSSHDKEMLKIMPFVRSLVDVRELFAEADKSQIRLKALEEKWKSDAPTPTDTEMEAANRRDRRLQTALKIREERARLFAAKDAARKALSDLNNDVRSLLKIGKTQYMAQQQERLEHRSEVSHIGIAAVDTGKERPAGVKGQQEAKESEEKSVGVLRRLWNWLFLAPTESAESMLSRVDVNHFSGEGELYHLIMESERGYSRSEDRRIESVEALRSEIHSKCKELFGSKNPKDGNKRIKFTQTLSGEPVPAEVTKGEALSLYLWSLSEEGRAKLESQGIDAFSISEIKAGIGDNWVKFGEWIVGDFLPKLYDKYNEKYVEKYGTEITRHENYFPFKIYGGDIVTKDELESFDNGNTIPMPSALKERVKHNYQLSTTEDALKILNEHVAEMEDWYHFADMREDISILLSSRAFRETLKLQGPNKWRKFRDAMHTLAGVDKRDESVTSQVINEVQSMYASSAVGFRYWTALKQLQSMIAGVNYSYNPRFHARLFANILMPVGTELLAGKVKNAENTFAGMVGSCYWAWKNLPQFRERYRNGKMGNIMLEYESVVGNSSSLYRWIKKNVSQKGLLLNKVFDAAAVAVYSKSIYDYEFTRSIRNGATEEDAHKYAMTCAETNYNKTQQSSGRAYVSKMQVSGNPIEKCLTTFQTASLGFMRKSINDINDIQRAYRLLRLGKEKPLHSISKGAKATVDLLWDGVVMPASWNLINVIGVAGFYYGAKAIFSALFGGDDDNAPTKDATGKTALDRFIEGHAGDVAFATISAPLQGTILNNFVNSVWSGYGGWTPTMAEGAISEVLRSAGETMKGYKDSDSLSDYIEDLDEDAAKYTIKTVLYALFRGYTGIDMKTVERFYNAFYDYKVKGSSLNLISVANFLSTPMSSMRDHEAKDYYLGAYGKTSETAKDLEDYIVKRAYADGKIFKREVESGGARGKIAELFRSRAFKRDLNKYVDEWAEYHIRDASDAAGYHDEWLKNHDRKEIIRKNRELEYSDEQAKQKTDSLKLALGYEQKSGNSERTLRYNLVHDILRQIKKKLTGSDDERKEAFALMRELERIDKIKGHTHSDYVKLAEKAGVKDFQMIPKGVSESGKYVNKSDIDNGTVARGDVKGSYGIIATADDVKADAKFRKLQDGSEKQKAKAKEVMKMYSDGDISYQDAYRRMTDIGDGLVTAVYTGEADRLIKDLKTKLTKAVKAGNNKASDAIMERIRSIRGKVIGGDMKPKEEVAKMLLNSIE